MTKMLGLRGIVHKLPNPAYQRWHNIFLVHLLESKKCAFMRNDVALNDGIVMDDLRVGDIVKVDMIKKGNSNDVLKQLEVTRLCEVEPRCFEHIKGNKIMGSVDKTVTGDGYELKNDAIGVISDPHKSCSSFPEGRHEVTIFLPPLNFYNNHLNSTTAFCDAFPFLVDHRAIEINPFVSQNELIRCEGIVVHQRNLFNDPMLFIFTKGCSPYTDILAILPENTGFRLGTFVSFMMLKADYEKRATKKKLQTDFSTIRQIDPPGGITSDVGAFDDIVRITIKDFSTTESTGPYTHEWIGNFDDPNRKLAPNHCYAHITLSKFSQPDASHRSPWMVSTAYRCFHPKASQTAKNPGKKEISRL